MSFFLLCVRIWSSCFLCIWFKKICNWLIIFCLCDVTFFRSLKWLCPNFLVTPMLSGLSKRILMVMFTLFTETNVGPCTIHHGANVGNSKKSHLTNIWMSENLKKRFYQKHKSNICLHFQLKNWEQILLICRYTGFKVSSLQKCY